MALHLVNLDERTRALMAAEIAADLAVGSLYLSPRLSPGAHTNYAALLQRAAQAGDDTSLANALRNGALFASHYQRRKPSGGTTIAKMPVDAPETLAEGEFNRFYIRAVCVRALADGIRHVAVYRARHSENPRPESQARIGSLVDTAALLSDLRSHPGVDTALGVPPGPNSGLSVYIP
jgi:hypothetical protein